MLSKSQIDLLCAGVRDYANHLGYKLTRTTVGPQVGNTSSGFNVSLKFQGFASRLYITISMKKDGIDMSAELINDGTNETIFKQSVDVTSDNLVDISKQVKDEILTKIPDNEAKALDMTESLFLKKLRESTKLLIENDFDRLFQ
jgi:hypothetical protein